MPTAFSRQLKNICLAGAALTALTVTVGIASSASAQVNFFAPAAPASDQAPVTAQPETRAATRPADAMTLGGAAPAPMGYLRFCARRPDQCGLENDPSLLTVGSDERAQQLMAKYYWSVAFSGGAPSNLRLMPTSGDGAGAHTPQASSGGRYDWSAIFGPAPAARPASAPEPIAPVAPPVVVAAASVPTTLATDAAVEAAPNMASDDASLQPAAFQPAATSSLTSFNLAQLFQSPEPESVSATDVSLPEQPATATAGEPALREATLNEPSIVASTSDATPGLTLLTWSSKPDVPVLSDAVLRSDTAPVLAAPAPVLATPAPATAAADPAQPPEAAPGPLVADHALMSMLDRVNLRVNDAIRYMPDERQYGVDDYWTLPLEAGGSAAGDCKDYVLEKRRALIEAGISASDLSIAIVKTTWGETHAVLLVSTDRGELVMDSLSSWIQPWRKVHYQWVERQAPGQQLEWVKIVTGRNV